MTGFTRSFKQLWPILLLATAAAHGAFAATGAQPPQPPVDWLVDPRPFVARVVEDKARHELSLENGLARRVIRLAPNAATINLQNLTSGEHLLRAVGPEARIAIDGAEFAVGGLEGQPVRNYIKDEWLNDLRANPGAYRFIGWSEGPIQARIAWKKHPEWLSRDLPWPPPGRHIVLRFAPPRANLPDVEIHYELYDGLPLLSKWLVVANGTKHAVRLTSFTAEELHLAEVETAVNSAPVTERQNLWVETDYAFGDMSPYYAQPAVSLVADPDYRTQVAYRRNSPCLLRCKPPIGPDQEIAPGGKLESFRAFVLLLDSSERERRTLAQRRMYRTIAPWTAENPLMFHKTGSDPKIIREAIEQARQVGFEMIVMSFGSGFNLESRDARYQALYKQLADEARAQGIALGGYSLLASRGAADAKDNTQGPRAMYGVMPCLGAAWGQAYLGQLRHFLGSAGLGVLEHDGSYPGDCCNSHDHPGHRGLEDSQWVQWRAITDFYKWCRAEGVFLNIPDWYFLAGGNKCGMGYRETNWSLPRAEQESIERQNIFDGTWNKTASMGWMFVPLSQYHGGGAAATIEPLAEHLDHYEGRLADLLGGGVQACYRGPRLYDTEATKAVVRKWVAFYKAHRQVLDGDLIHLRRANGLDWDGWLHVNPQGREKALAFFYNPLPDPVTREIRVPLHYAGLTDEAQVSVEGAAPLTLRLDRTETAALQVKIPARGRTWLLFTGTIASTTVRAEELPPIKDGQKIAFLGDSITREGARGPTGYVNLVIRGLESNGIKATAIPAGVNGNKSGRMLGRLQKDILSKKPDWMTLNCGVNDAAHDWPLDDYKKNITSIVEQCQAADVKVMILTATMIGEDPSNANNHRLAAYNAFLRTLAKEKNCRLADLNADMQATLVNLGPVKKGNRLTRDGCHMNPDGNRVMATGVLKAFGLSAEQIDKAKKGWADAPPTAVPGRKEP